MKVLLLGLSSFAVRRLLPVFSRHPKINSWDLASRRPVAALPVGVPRTIYRTFEDALDKSNADVVWISTENSAHFGLASLALSAGKHVVIDKPACLTNAECKHLLAQSIERELLVAEATIFFDHPQIRTAMDLVKRSGGILRGALFFCIPPMQSEDFRYDEHKGGGCLNDMGPYFAASCRLIFEKDFPVQIFAAVNRRDRNTGIDLSFSALAASRGGCSVVGQFGFDGCYTNQILLQGPRASVLIKRAFSPPAGQELTLEIVEDGRTRQEPAGFSDSVEVFFDRLALAIEQKRFAEFRETMQYDAAVRESLRVQSKNAS